MIEALPTCAPSGGRPKYPPVRYGDYPMERIDKNYHYRKGLTGRRADPFTYRLRAILKSEPRERLTQRRGEEETPGVPGGQ